MTLILITHLAIYNYTCSVEGSALKCLSFFLFNFSPSISLHSSLSLSNLGTYGVTEFTAIINPPQTAILAVGSIQAGPSVGSQTGADGGVSRSITATLSSDSRVVDFELSCHWLGQFRQVIEQPDNQLL